MQQGRHLRDPEPGSGEALLERVEVYRPQLEAYRRALAAITGLDLRAIEGSLLFLSPGRRISL